MEEVKKSLKQEQRQWTLRYKYGNHPAETGLVIASSLERAERVGRAWCRLSAAGKMQSIRFIRIEDPVLADETILGDET